MPDPHNVDATYPGSCWATDLVLVGMSAAPQASAIPFQLPHDSAMLTQSHGIIVTFTYIFYIFVNSETRGLVLFNIMFCASQ